MPVDRLEFVHEAELDLGAGVDERDPGAAVTVALCGHYEHEGGCRWPHNNAIALDGSRGVLRTVFVAPAAEETLVRERIDTGLRDAVGWTVVSAAGRALSGGDQELAARLARTPRP